MLIPANISEFASNGERLLYQKFKNDETASDLIVLHSVFTSRRMKAVSGELDFLILAPNRGIFALEVKHGDVMRRGGEWMYADRSGKYVRKTQSPFAQVHSTMHSIRNYILEKTLIDPALNSRLEKCLWSSAVAFTSSTTRPDLGVEARDWQVILRNDLTLPIAALIKRLSDGAHKSVRHFDWYDSKDSRPKESDCQKIAEFLRGDFEINYSSINRLTDGESLIESFTKEQFELLDFVRYNDRCLIQGGAGTGKTVMAMEIAKREIEAGKKVAFFCYNKKLAANLESSLKSAFPDSKKIFVGGLHKYLAEATGVEFPAGREDLNRYFREELPMEFLIRNEDLDEEKKFDCLILDEAQDLISPYYIEVFDTILKSGLANGRWVFFGDFSNQAIFSEDPEESFNLLNEKSTFTIFPPLKVNCRNTKKIAEYNSKVTGAEPPDFRNGSVDGEPIETIFVDEDEINTEIEKLLREMLQSGISLEKISILSPRKLENTTLKDSNLVRNFLENGLTFSTIQSFKGLENSIVLITGFKEIKSAEAKRLLYVAISRAKLKLFAVLDKSFKRDYFER